LKNLAIGYWSGIEKVLAQKIHNIDFTHLIRPCGGQLIETISRIQMLVVGKNMC